MNEKRGGQFTPKLGGQFKPNLGGQFKLKLGGQYHRSLQYDDIIDFTEDFNKKQFNWAVYELSKTLDFSKYKYDVNILNKLFYIDGTSVILFEKSIYYLEKAKKVIEKLPPDSLWLDTICDFEKTILHHK